MTGFQHRNIRWPKVLRGKDPQRWRQAGRRLQLTLLLSLGTASDRE
jgi:hypothetical protein